MNNSQYLVAGMAMLVGFVQLWLFVRTHNALGRELERRNPQGSLIGGIMARVGLLTDAPGKVVVEIATFIAGVLLIAGGIGMLLWGIDTFVPPSVIPSWTCPKMLQIVPDTPKCADWAYQHTAGTCVLPSEFGVLTGSLEQSYREYCALLFAEFGP